MQYFVAIHITTVSTGRSEREKDNVSLPTEYVRAFSKEDAETIAEGFNSLSHEVYRDGPYERTRSAEICIFIRDAEGRGIYLPMSDVEMIVSDYTAPRPRNT